MKPETLYNKLSDQLTSHLEDNTNQLNKKDFDHLGEEIAVFRDNLAEISCGIITQRFLLDLGKISSEINKTSQALEKKSATRQIDHFRDEIKVMINNFQAERQEFEKAREEVYSNYAAKINKLRENIELDFEFLFERYKRRVSLNIGSKFFDLLKLEDDFEIRTFLLESVFTSKRLQNDLIELSNTCNGQITKFMNKLTNEMGVEIYKKLPDSDLSDKDFGDTKITADLQEQVKIKEIFSSDSDAVRELLTTILFSLAGGSKATVYALLQNKNETNKLSDLSIKKYMKKMEQQLNELVKKLDWEINTRIEDKIYPIRSYFNRFQDRVLEKFLYPTNEAEQVLKAIEVLGNNIMFTQDKSNYQILKDIFA